MRALLALAVLIVTSAQAVVADPNRNSKEGFQALFQGDQKKFFEHALKDAEGGLKEAQLMVALVYERGAFGAPPDHAEAFKWYRRAAEADQPDAELSVGRFDLEGRHIKQDFLGDFIPDRPRRRKDPARAVLYYVKAAEANVVQSQAKLAGFYFAGNHVAQDKPQGYFWARVAQSNAQKMPGVDFEKVVPTMAAQLTPDQRAQAERKVAKFVTARAADEARRRRE